MLSQIAQLSFTVFRFREKCFYILEREEKDIFVSLSVINSSSDVTEKLLVFSYRNNPGLSSSMMAASGGAELTPSEQKELDKVCCSAE